MLNILIGLSPSPADKACSAVAVGRFSPLVISHRSAHILFSAARAKDAISSLLIGLPLPVLPSFRALHCMAIRAPSERWATASIPMSWAVVPGKIFSLSGHSAQSQHAAISQSEISGETSTVTRSSHFPPVGWLLAVSIVTSACCSCVV